MRTTQPSGGARFGSHLYTHILVVFLLLSSVPLVLLNYSWYLTTRQSFIEIAQANAERLLTQVTMNLESSFGNVNTVLLSVIFDNNINTIIGSPSEEPQQNGIDAGIIAARLNTAKSLNGSIAAFTIISRDRIYAVSSAGDRVNYDELFQQDWYRRFVQSGAPMLISNIHDCTYISRINLPTYAVLLRFQSDDSNLRNGYLIAEVYAADMLVAFENMVIEGSTGVLVSNDDQETIFISGDDAFMRTGKAGELEGADVGAAGPFANDDSEYFVTSRRMPQLDWTISLFTSEAALMSETYHARDRGYIYLFLLLALVAAGVMILARNITRPILSLSSATEQVIAGDLSIQVPILTRDEVGQMGDNFNIMIRHIKQLVSDIQRSEKAMFDAEIHALQAQINPHFLYNTLNVIRWLALMREYEKIDRMTVALVKLLEFSRDDNRIFVGISRELEHVRQYVELMGVRYEGRFLYEEHVDPAALELLAIRFTLQPLVENAVFHGIDPLDRVGTVRVKVWLDMQRVFFEVSDDGVGVDLQQHRSRFFSGIGVSNVNERLVQQLDPDCAVQVDSVLGHGTRIWFSIPAMRVPPERRGSE